MSGEKQLELFSVWGSPIEEAVYRAFPEGESLVMEYKSAKGGFPDSFWETYSAFANTEGGIIVLGVKEKNYNLIPDGLTRSQIQQYRKVFFDTSNNRNKISHNLLTDRDVQVLPVPNDSSSFLLAFQVPRARLEQMPVYKGPDMFTGTYKRNDTGDYLCDRDAVRRLVSDSNPASPVDGKILRNFSISDLDPASLRQYRQLMANRKPDHPWLVLEDQDFLQKLGAWRKERGTGIEGITLAGLLMFGRTEAITDPDGCSNFFPEYREVLTQDLNIRWTDRIYADGTWETNLFQFYQRVWPRLSAGLPRPFQLKNGVRQDETPAHVALREAFVNALIHADYSAPGNLTVTRRLTGFEFQNPGTLLISQRQYYEGGTSVCRNKALQKMFMMLGRAEQAGSGSGKIVSGWESAQWQRPYLTLKDQPDQVILSLHMESMLPEEALKRLEKLFGQQAHHIYGDDLSVLSLAAQEGSITNQRLQYWLNLHRVDISALLKRLCQEGFLEPSGKGRWTVYTLRTDYLANKERKTVNEGAGAAPAMLNQKAAGAVAENLESTDENLERKVENLERTGENLESVINPEGGKKRKTPAAILQFVRDKFETAEAISEAIGKSAAYLKNEVLPKMVEEGSLVLKYPETPTHRSQAYKAAPKG